MTEEFVEVNGIQICYEIRGEGDPVVLIHGFGVAKEEWIGQFDPLSEHFKVIRFDNRGSGKSDHPEDSFTMKNLADDLNGLLDKLGIIKANVVGWSLGGMIAEEFAINYPQALDKLVLINTFPYWPGDENGLQMYKQSKLDALEARKIDPVKAFYDGATPGFSRKFKKLLLEEPKKKIHGLFSAEDLIEKGKTNPITPKDIEHYTQALGKHDTLDRLPKIKNDTLIISGTHDRSTPLSMNQIIHKNIPNSKLLVLEKAGHQSPIERAPEVNQAIIEFLKN